MLTAGLNSGTLTHMNTKQRQSRTKVINVEQVPEPVALALAAVVDALKQQFEPKNPEGQRVHLAVRPGKVIGSLRREDIYADAI